MMLVVMLDNDDNETMITMMVKYIQPNRLLCVLTELTKAELDLFLTPHDLNRLEKYAQNMVDYHMVMDLLPTLARLYFTRRLDVSLNELKSVSFAVCFVWTLSPSLLRCRCFD